MFKVTTLDSVIRIYATTEKEAFYKVCDNYGYAPNEILCIGVCYE
jgi:hypothetical protein